MRLILISLSFILVTSCKSRSSSSLREDEIQQTEQSIKLKVQTGKMYKMTEQEIQRVVDALKEVKEAFYVPNAKGYEQLQGTAPNFTYPPLGDVNSCMGASPAQWSDLSQHYYSHMPSYSPHAFPNIRECFSYLATGSLKIPTQPGITMLPSGRPPYPAVYDYCVFMALNRENFDPAGKLKSMSQPTLITMPVFDPKYKNENKAVGPLKWVHERQEDVFKFVMYTTPCTIDPESQQEVLNRFYGVDLKGKNTYTAADTEQVKECNTKRTIKGNYSPNDGTHCSYDMRKKKPLAENCYAAPTP